MNRHTMQAGLSLIELMVAITLTLLLALGLTQVFVSSKHGYRVQESASRLQDNARVAIDVISRNVRMADFWGGVKSDAITGTPTVTGESTAPCTAAWIADPTTSLTGYEGAAAAPLNCLDNDYQPDTDVLAVKFADPNGFATDSDIGGMSGAAVFLRVATGRNGYLFNLDDKATAEAKITHDSADDGNGVMNFPYEVSILFIRKCSTQNGGACTAASDGGVPIPTLVSLELTSAGNLEEKPLVENVEQLQFEYGIDGDNDGIVDQYKSADDVTTAEWLQVISVRAGIIIRGDAIDNFSDSETYALPGGDYTPPAAVRRFQRRMFVKDILVRNRIRG